MFTIIVACDKNNGIGKNNDLPWKLKKDMKHFSETTKKRHYGHDSNVVIMGRKTYESIPKKFRPLPERTNIVITKNKNYKSQINDDVLIAHSFEEALKLARKTSFYSKIFVIGGAQIYKEAFKHVGLNEIFLTKIELNFDCDTFIDFDLSNFYLRKVNYIVENNTHYNISQFCKK